MLWPNNIPADLRRQLAATLSRRNVGPAEIWGDVRDWLILHGIEPPNGLPEDTPPERWVDQ